MKFTARSGISLSGFLVLAMALASCGGGSSSGPTSPPPAVPTVSSFLPASGPVGTSVVVTGTNLNGTSAVSFNGTTATFTANSATQITATVPTGATTGKIAVTTSVGNATSTSNFTVTATVSSPTITNFAPSSGPAGTAVTITGTNLDGASAVKLNGTTAAYTVNSATQITATVPQGSTTGKFTVTTPGGTATAATDFTVTVPAPTISGFNPTSGPVGTPVVITGTNLSAASLLTFNGVTATITTDTATQITANVPAGATTGKLSVTTPGGSATSANNFTVNSASSTLDLVIDGLYLTQATQDYPNPSVPLVKDRSAWVRVFVRANTANTATPQVKVQFTPTNTLTISAPSNSVPTSIDPNTDASWDAPVPSAWIQPGVQVTATVDPSNLIAEADKTNNQFSTDLDVRTLPQYKVTLLPVHTKDGRTGVVESGSFTRNSWVDFAKRLHPVPDSIDVTVGSTLNSSATGNPTLSSNGHNWDVVLNDINAKRTADGASASGRYYFGVVKVNYTSGVAGLGFVGRPAAAMGWDYTSNAAQVFAHEEGHNFGRLHAPCGNVSNPDTNYPYPGGEIGVPGWDAFASGPSLKDETAFTDIMGYCADQWISDYGYTSELNFRTNGGFDVATADVANDSNPKDGLLIWGRIVNGNVILEPAFKLRATGIAPEPGPYVWQAKDAVGQVLMTMPFDAAEVADMPDTSLRLFSFVVPMSTDTMNKIASVNLSKDGRELVRTTADAAVAPMLAARAVVKPQFLPNKKMQFSWDATQSPMVMLRDAKTGEVRGFLRGGNADIEDVPDDLEVQFSDGIHSSAVEYQRPIQ